VKMEVDEALQKVEVGRWQILHYTLIGITCNFTACFHMLAIIYIGKCTSSMSTLLGQFIRFVTLFLCVLNINRYSVACQLRKPNEKI